MTKFHAFIISFFLLLLQFVFIIIEKYHFSYFLYILSAIFLITQSCDNFIKVAIIFLVFYTNSIFQSINGQILSAYNAINQSSYVSVVLLNNAIFITAISILSIIFYKKNIQFSIKKYEPNFLYYLLVSLSLLIPLISLSGENLLESQLYGTNKDKSPIYEYSIIIFLLIYFKYKVDKLFWLSTIIYILRTLIYGGRIEALELVMGLYFIRSLGLSHIPRKHLFYLTGCAFIFYFFGFLRENIFNIINEDFSFFNDDRLYVVGSSADIIYSSMRILFIFENFNYDIFDRLYSFILFIVSPLFQDKAIDSLQQLPLLHKNTYESGGGGLFYIFFYSTLGTFGILISSIFTILPSIKRNISENYFFIAVLTFSSMPRWLLYNPTVLLRYAFFGYLLYFYFSKS